MRWFEQFSDQDLVDELKRRGWPMVERRKELIDPCNLIAFEDMTAEQFCLHLRSCYDIAINGNTIPFVVLKCMFDRRPEP